MSEEKRKALRSAARTTERVPEGTAERSENENEIHSTDGMYETENTDGEASNGIDKEAMAKLQAEVRELRQALMKKNKGKEKQNVDNDVVMEDEGNDGSPLSSPELGPRANSPTNSQFTAATSTIHENEIVKELIKLIPRYDGQGSVQKLTEYIRAFQTYSDAASDSISSRSELALATAKLTGDAALWWEEHCRTVPVKDSKRIRSWEALKKALLQTFAPVEHLHNLRDKLSALRQKSTVLVYTNEFRKIAMQIPNLGFEEAQHAYLRGLNAKIRDLVLTREGFTDIRSLQNACLRLDTNTKSSEEEALYSEGSRGGRGGYRGRGGGNFRGRGQ